MISGKCERANNLSSNFPCLRLTFGVVNQEAKKNNQRLLKPFVLYSFRHTFLTRLAESGCDAWTLARIAGWSDISISKRYVHPSEDAVLNALSRMPQMDDTKKLTQ